MEFGIREIRGRWCRRWVSWENRVRFSSCMLNNIKWGWGKNFGKAIFFCIGWDRDRGWVFDWWIRYLWRSRASRGLTASRSGRGWGDTDHRDSCNYLAISASISDISEQVCGCCLVIWEKLAIFSHFIPNPISRRARLGFGELRIQCIELKEFYGCISFIRLLSWKECWGLVNCRRFSLFLGL